ncbi:adenylate/guanylate cyclase domain-containing protein [Leptospira kanakyensis]|uniref:Adenylate cyclase n=1 Tax=Leptospira kanakyensis TaxID=2484968 RepID=A0A6N4Q732_9LEPT|nr:adenylate/guanylate cyclase domain-containing protein [Leptospira kanakyensis]TGK49441.1 adenylate/guanylate cyclase domain-containing protein [Leptospira kanakyensis]TGK60319.1 adenylate/guanylate cyclase domain-containing protein [Leptospira kanakyensis]TGK67718.1 adenylate/guanylate cyclase domain-containing protein [Leptospira kanakyensis]
MKFIGKIWTTILNIGVTETTYEKDAKFIRLTNALAIIVGIWLFSIIPSLLPYYPSSQYIIYNSIFFPAIWLFVLYFNHRGWYTFAKLFFSYTAMVCVVFNSLQAGRESDNHLFLLLISIMAFYTFPPEQLKYISRVSLSALILFIAVEVYLTNKGPIIQAPPEFFQLGRLITLVALCILVYIVTLYNYKTLHKAQDLLEIEHQKSESLLLNILPPTIANRLKSKNEIIADKTNEATILFADIVDFTVVSQTMEPEKIVSLLNDIFSEFDTIIKNRNLEKIKTIGDAYMVASGIPESRADHCEAVALCALDMLTSIKKGITDDSKNFKIRIGIHTGPVVAGVIGKSKFIYDLWGDSVNTASRMESHGAEGKIHVSKDVFEKLKNKFKFEEKREIPVKGKGIMETYFLVQKI